MIRLRPPNDVDFKEPFEEQSAAAVTYADVGATKRRMPAGFTHDELSFVLGKGRELFDAGAKHLHDWGLQKSLGFEPYPKDCRAVEDATVLLALPIFGVRIVAACRVIYAVNSEDRKGFAYGTLPMHPECGEEYFGVRIDSDDIVHFELRAFSRPRWSLARLGGPITRQVQLRAMNRYGANMKEFAANFQVG